MPCRRVLSARGLRPSAAARLLRAGRRRLLRGGRAGGAARRAGFRRRIRRRAPCPRPPRRRSRSPRARRRTCRRSGATSARTTAASATASRRPTRSTLRSRVCGVRSPADVRYGRRRRRPGLGSHPARRLGARLRPLQGADALHAARVLRRRELRDPRVGLHGQPARAGGHAGREAPRADEADAKNDGRGAVARARGAGAGALPSTRGRPHPSPRRRPRFRPRTRARRRGRAPRDQGRRGSAAPLAAHPERSRRLAARRFPAEPGPRRTAASSAWKARPAAGCSARRCASACASTPTGRCSRRFSTPARPPRAVFRGCGSRARSIRPGTPRGTSRSRSGLGFGGIVEGFTGRPDVDPLPGAIETSYTFPSASPPLPSCSGVGVAGLARAEWTFVLGPRTATGLGLEAARAVDGLRGRDRARRARHAGRRSCAASTGRTSAPSARGASRGAEARRAGVRGAGARDRGAARRAARARAEMRRHPGRRRRARHGVPTRAPPTRRRGRRDAPAGRRRRRDGRRARGLRAAARAHRHAGPLPGRRPSDRRAGAR